MDENEELKIGDLMPKIKQNKSKIELWLLIIICVVMIVLSLYSIKVQNDYNTIVMAYNELSRNCVALI